MDGDGIPYLTPEERDQELHLLYVAVTRARQQLELNDAVRSCLAPRAVWAAVGEGAPPEGAVLYQRPTLPCQAQGD